MYISTTVLASIFLLLLLIWPDFARLVGESIVLLFWLFLCVLAVLLMISVPFLILVSILS